MLIRTLKNDDPLIYTFYDDSSWMTLEFFDEVTTWLRDHGVRFDHREYIDWNPQSFPFRPTGEVTIWEISEETHMLLRLRFP